MFSNFCKRIKLVNNKMISSMCENLQLIAMHYTDIHGGYPKQH